MRIERFIMQSAPTNPPKYLAQALREMIRSPIRTIAPPWSWKAATLSAVLRALTFFVFNLPSGRPQATKAMLVEAVFSIFAAGLIGAVSQQLRQAEPLWATALFVWAGMPALMLLAQLAVHHLARTPHLGGGIAASFGLASLASAFSWYAMRHGAMLGGVDETPILDDLSNLPGVVGNFLLAAPRLIAKVWRARK